MRRGKTRAAAGNSRSFTIMAAIGSAVPSQGAYWEGETVYFMPGRSVLRVACLCVSY